jgi:hypothetical protein
MAMTFRYPLNGAIYPGAMVGVPSLLTLLMIDLSCRPDVVWWFFLPPALLTAAMAFVAYFYYPTGISVAPDVITIRYLFGNRLSFPAAAVEWSFPTGRLAKGVVRDKSTAAQLFGTFVFVTTWLQGGDTLAAALRSDERSSPPSAGQ